MKGHFMFMRLFQKLTIGAAGLTAFGIGLAITLAPHSFYAGYGIDLGADPTLLSELRAPGANLAALGTVIFAGALRSGMARLSAMLGAIVFLAFAIGRVVSLALDGWPVAGVLAALAIELVIGLLCFFAVRVQGPGHTPAKLAESTA
ncbi:DUF4345 domain-containing protein [Leisingera daeponensis]|uniref:DUF4345 domain-containing protein n=1 Tax=Leisingera daeponensis TaxID=405746 RepID=UPI001C981608|nr:DUF4345 domain-containing protein [Leisingera daeponensis]MBY6059005.1 DUF4345 domain-containing protein [Leisingera daeponensis]